MGNKSENWNMGKNGTNRFKKRSVRESKWGLYGFTGFFQKTPHGSFN